MLTLKQRTYGTRQLYIPNIRDEALVEGITAIERYKLRIISVCDPEDMAVMPEMLRPFIKDQLDIFKNYGLPAILAERIICVDAGHQNISKAILKNIDNIRRVINTKNGPVGLMPYISSFNIDAISEQLGLSVRQCGTASDLINNKAIAQEELRRLGVQTPLGKIICSCKQGEEFAERLQKKGYEEVGFKIIHSASGMGVFRIGIDEVSKYLKKYEGYIESEGILMDGWISGNITSYPNVQFFIGETPEQDLFISCSKQIISGTSHQGNINEPEILKRVSGLGDNLLTICNWIRSKGGYGINGIDFLVREEGEAERAYFLENNGRINGCTHGVVLADKIQHLYGPSDRPLEWGVNNNILVPASTTAHTFQRWLETSGIAFKSDWTRPPGSSVPNGPRGVLITNTAAIESHGKIMVLIVSGSREDVCEMMDMLPTNNNEL